MEGTGHVDDQMLLYEGETPDVTDGRRRWSLLNSLLALQRSGGREPPGPADWISARNP